MTKTELESKHLADLHQLAADRGVERYRMLTRAELIERLSDGDAADSTAGGSTARGSTAARERGERPRRRRRSGSGGREREERLDVEEEEEKLPESPPPERAPAPS